MSDQNQTHDVNALKEDYLKGFKLSIILTVIPFFLASFEFLTREASIILVVVCAVIQVLVHFGYFLHMRHKDPETGWNKVSLVFTAIVVFIIVAGSIWIMWNMNHNMMM